MAHEILGNRFIARERPAWHNIASRIFSASEKITARQAMVEVAGDIAVVKYPLFYENYAAAPPGSKMVRVEGQSAIVRGPLPDSKKEVVLGIAADSWTATSYVELASALDPLSESYAVETAGVLKEGALAFLCFRAEDWNVRGDEMRSYFASNFSLQPGYGHKVFHSPVRVVCWNTNVQAENAASINLSIPHTSDAVQKIRLAASLAARFREMKDKAKTVFEAFADFRVSAAEAETIFRAAFPAPVVPAKIRLVKSQLNETEAEEFKRALTADLLMALENAQEKYDRDCAKIEELVRTCSERFDQFEPANLRGTAWAAYNAVTEVSDWREGKNADLSAVLGSRAQEKSRAYAAAIRTVGK